MTAAARHRPDRAILDDLTPLLTEAYADTRVWIQPPPGHHRDESYLPADLVRRITWRLQEALAAGLTAGQIVLHSRMPWAMVLRWIDVAGTLADRIDARRAHVHYLEQSLTAARLGQARLARDVVDGYPGRTQPMTKIDAAAKLGISRPTLDKWLDLATQQ